MDFARLTAEDILDALHPGDEDNRWEWKSSVLLSPAQKGELKKELGKQVSAFANSGGGNLVFGISTTRVLEPCEMKVGRQSMKDYLATMVEQSVEHPIRHFRIHQIPFRANPNQAIFVVEIGDSPAAPHQAKDERAYYYRIDGHSKPAPHFHLELLRNRMTKAVLSILEVGHTVDFPAYTSSQKRLIISPDGSAKEVSNISLNVRLSIKISNLSKQIANPYALRLSGDFTTLEWDVDQDKQSLLNGILLRTHSSLLFPLTSDVHEVNVHTSIADDEPELLAKLASRLASLEIQLQPLSQDYAGEVVLWKHDEDTNSVVENAWARRQRELDRWKELGAKAAANFKQLEQWRPPS